MDKSEIRTMLKLVWYLRPGRKMFLKAAPYSVFVVFFLTIITILRKAHGSLVYIFLLLLMMFIPLFAAYYASDDLRSLLHCADDRKTVLNDFENSSGYFGGEVRLGEFFIFPRKGENPVRYESISRMDLEWVAGKGYGILITLFEGGKLVVSEDGTGPLTRREGRNRYRTFIRELQRHSPGITYEFGEDESECPYMNGNAETDRKNISKAETAMWEYIQEPNSYSVMVVFLILVLFALGFFGYFFISTWIPDSDLYMEPVPRIMVMCIYISVITLCSFLGYTGFKEMSAGPRALELMKQTFRAEGLAEEMVNDFENSVPYLDDHLRFGDKYLFPYHGSTICKYSDITKVQHDQVINGRSSAFLYKITEKGNRFISMDEKPEEKEKVQCIIALKPGFLNGFRFDKYCLPADEELRKKNPDIVFAPWRD